MMSVVYILIAFHVAHNIICQKLLYYRILILKDCKFVHYIPDSVKLIKMLEYSKF